MQFNSREKLVEKINFYSKQIVESRQISQRLKKLLPERLKELKKSYATSSKASKATRQALCDQKYHAFILEYLNIKEESHKSRILWETHRMYFQTKKAQRTHFRPFQ